VLYLSYKTIFLGLICFLFILAGCSSNNSNVESTKETLSKETQEETNAVNEVEEYLFDAMDVQVGQKFSGLTINHMNKEENNVTVWFDGEKTIRGSFKIVDGMEMLLFG
jgi:uncharacterized protein YcfL